MGASGNWLWRMGWDSNPRDPLGPAGFQDRYLQPLGHPSLAARTDVPDHDRRTKSELAAGLASAGPISERPPADRGLVVED